MLVLKFKAVGTELVTVIRGGQDAQGAACK